MKNPLSPTYRACLLGILLGLGSVPSVLAQPLRFTGRWAPDQQAGAAAASTILTIKKAILSWRGPDTARPACVQEFVVKTERPGTIYTDGRGAKFVAGAPGSLPTFLLKIGASTCGNAGEEVRISFPLVYDTRHMELTEYKDGKPVASRRFYRMK